jgi:hypothetical protein
MNEELSNKLTYIIENLYLIPSFNNAILFSNDIADILGFQINCNMNSKGRLIFSPTAHSEAGMTLNESIYIFKEKYEEIFKYNIRDEHDSNTDIYPIFDHINDISPTTIIKIMKSSLNDKNNKNPIPDFITNLHKEIKKWNEYFASYLIEIDKLTTESEDILNRYKM